MTALLAVVVWAGCKGDPPPAPPAAPGSPPAARAVPPKPVAAPPKPAAQACTEIAPLPHRLPAAPRIVAIGDLHGDLDAARRALRLAGAMDANEHWIGGALVLVQTGDILDRGDGEQAILDLLARLADEARAAGGAVHVLLGNHETMNAIGDFRYVTPGGLADFADVDGLALDDPAVARLPTAYRPRVAAFMPGGPYARRLARSNAVVMVGDTVFVHGGVLPEWADYGIDRMNHELRCWLDGHKPPPALLLRPDNPLWSRDYSQAPERCDLLARALDTLGAARMVVGHTPQLEGISSACDGRVWRIDTGLAAHYGGPTQVLEIQGNDVRPLHGGGRGDTPAP